MRKSRFTEEQIITALKEHAAGTPAKELCRRLGVGPETLYRWKHKYGGMEVSEARRLRALALNEVGPSNLLSLIHCKHL